MNGRIESRGVIHGKVQMPIVSDGKSAYEIAVENGFIGTVDEWLASLHKEALDTELSAQGVAVASLEEYVDELGNTASTYTPKDSSTPNDERIEANTAVILATKTKLEQYVNDLPNNPMFQPELTELLIPAPTVPGTREYAAGSGVYADYDGFSRVTATAPADELVVTENNSEWRDIVRYGKLKVNVPIPDGYIVPGGTLDITENGEHNVTDKAKVNVNVPIPDGYVVPLLQEKLAVPSEAQQEITADKGWTALSKVVVPAVTSAVDSNIQPNNIRKGVTILGVAGTRDVYIEVSTTTEAENTTTHPISNGQVIVVVPLIWFTYAGVEKQAFEGMTWTEYCNNQQLNTIGVSIQGNKVAINNGYVVRNGSYVLPSDPIVENAQYSWGA